MVEGIKLSIDGDDVTVDTGRKKQMCFGGAMCGWLEVKPWTTELCNGEIIEVAGWFCHQDGKYVCELDVCPEKLWQKMTVPVGAQNRFA